MIDITQILNGKCGAMSFEYDIAAPEHFSDFVFTSPVRVNGSVRNAAGYMTMSLHVRVRYTTHCIRCVKELEKEFETTIEKTLVRQAEISKSGMDDDTYFIYAGQTVDPDDLIGEVIESEIDPYPLCGEDCKGLCPKCGKDLNEGECGCDLREKDPRMAIFKNILDK